MRPIDGYGADRKGRASSRPKNREPLDKMDSREYSETARSVTVELAASPLSLVFAIFMVCLLLVGIGLLTGFFPLTLLGLTLLVVIIVGGLVIAIWRSVRPPKLNTR